MFLVTSIQELKNWTAHPRRNLSKWLMKRQVRNQEFTIISNDCWGSQIYQELDLPYKTPFVGLFVMTPCYLKLLQNLKGSLLSPLTFTNQSRYQATESYYLKNRQQEHWYPIGLLKGEVEIHFIHYASEAEAWEKWNRRIDRVLWHPEKLFIKFSDNLFLCRDEDIIAFDQLNLPNKVCFTPQSYPDLQSVVWIKGYVNNGVKMYQLCKKNLIFRPG